MKTSDYKVDLFGNLNKLSTTVKYVFVRENVKTVEILCLVCNPRKSQNLFHGITGKTLTIKELETFHRKLHSDFRREPVIHHDLWIPWDCSPYKVKLYLSHRNCAQLVIALKLNYTMAHTTPGRIILNHDYFNMPYLGSVVGGVYSTPQLNQFLHKYKILGMFEHVVTGEEYFYYDFVWAVNPDLVQVGIFTAMNINLWVATLFFVLATSLALGAVMGWKNTKKGDLFHATHLVLSILLKQSQLPSKNGLRLLGSRGAVLVCFWACIAVVISNVYKGELYSSLTSTDVPMVPSNIKEILETKETIELYRAIKFTNSSVSEVAFLDLSKDRRVFVNLTSEKFAVPSHFIFFGTSDEVDLFTLMGKIAGTQALTLKGMVLPLFSRRVPFVLQRTVLLPPFTQALFSLVESGIWGFWAGHSQANYKSWEVERFLAMKDESSEETLNSKRNFLTLNSRKRKFNLLALLWDDTAAWKSNIQRNGDHSTVVFEFVVCGKTLRFQPFICFGSNRSSLSDQEGKFVSHNRVTTPQSVVSMLSINVFVIHSFIQD
ncbi:unnamed protein product [Allacma fusca]|uniref:Uncharacterized protein n=1 Tax=Allacma fusca TaxID=39272 RepID=A0A8J2PRX7_9HEXA|nr:unnamed protein product [Allacma fusca]